MKKCVLKRRVCFICEMILYKSLKHLTQYLAVIVSMAQWRHLVAKHRYNAVPMFGHKMSPVLDNSIGSPIIK